ncbi:sulfatase [Aquamicrobium terrae]|uniref:Arylsulfatase A-like enzyme n=1 Tax=Aquamicrobium terrae TaxID=1324945 RepID=A0ABV2N7E6_9HYPH
MKAVFVLYDSLNRHALGCYGGGMETRNFDRLAARSVRFDNHYVGSLPCMPARRDMQTGRLSLLHRAWGPLEPYDNAFPDLLAEHGVYSHLVTDHYHYWEDGGATFHGRYDTFELVRGQERDPWQAVVEPDWAAIEAHTHPRQFSRKRREKFAQYALNRERFERMEDFPSYQCFAHALRFLDRNRDSDNWLLHLETFDPHEPFHAPDAMREGLDSGYQGPRFDWPPYARVSETVAEQAELRANYHALVRLCDHELGLLLDYFDAHDLWSDTAIILTTDHGFLLGEHGWWAKLTMPCFNEVAHIPLLVAHPDFRSRAGESRRALTQTIDLMPTILDMFDVPVPEEVLGHSLLPLLEADRPLREAAIYGVFGSALNVTDGRYTYFRYPADMRAENLFQYTLMPAHMRCMFSVEELRDAELHEGFGFTKGVPLLKVPATPKSPVYFGHGPGAQQQTDTVLFDLATDPGQLNPIADPVVEARMAALATRLMAQNDAPPEAYDRLGLTRPSPAALEGAAS